MFETVAITEQKHQMLQSKSRRAIPKELIYEKFDGKNIYYKGYKEVINNLKTIEEIMGSSILQSLIISRIYKYFSTVIDDNLYEILISELGLHIDFKNNLCADIAIYDRKVFKNILITDKYSEIPPKIIIEVDIKADLNYFDGELNYYESKTKKLFDFGVEKVVWILSKSKRIIEFLPNHPFYVAKWSQEIEILPGYKIILDNLIPKE